MIKGVTHAHLRPIWYHSEPSDIPYFPNQFLGWDCFCRFLQQDGSGTYFISGLKTLEPTIFGLKMMVKSGLEKMPNRKIQH